MIIYENTIPAMAIWTGIGIAAAIIVFGYMRYIKLSLSVIIMALFRALFMALLAWCLFQPQLKRTKTEKLKPRFVVAVDNSQSMTLRPKEDIPTRWSVAKNALNESWTKSVGAECDIDTYSFSESLGSGITLADAIKLEPDGKTTLLRDSLRKLSDRYKGQNVVGLLVLTDGMDTREAYDDWAAESWSWPIFSLRIEPDAVWEEEPDLRVDTIKTPRRVTVGFDTELTAVISGQGTKGQAVNIQLLKDKQPIQELPVQIPREGGSKELTFHLTNPEIGAFQYEVIAPCLPKEIHTNDNSYAVNVRVVDIKNRLLYVEGTPRWESKFLSRALKESKTVTPLCFIRGPGGNFLFVGQRGNMTADMKESQLAFFKIVVLGNLDAEELGEERAKNLLAFVEEGGSLILLGGVKAWGLDGFWKTSLSKLMPVKSFDKQLYEGTFPVEVIAQGHPILAGDPQLWQSLPPILSVFPNASISPGAEALVAAKTDKGPCPVIISQRYGQGKVVAIMSDSLWKWQLSQGANENKPYQRFWEQMILWLSPSGEEVAEDTLEIFADREQLFLGEKIELSARLSSNKTDSKSAEEEISCEITTPDKRTLPFSMAKQHVVTSTGKSFPGFTYGFLTQTPGLHTVAAVTGTGPKQRKSDPISFFVKPFTPESIPKPANIKLMKTITANSGGKFFEDINTLNDTLSSLQFTTTEEESVKYRSLWSDWIIISCLIGLLTIEWSLRKFRNLP